ncbi:MAG: hypothetical protein IKF14_09695 [Atopobiaceae bacterium]|nr:hypothetical protein [Atopobiaceae bacterium]
MYRYLTLNDGTEVVHSDMMPDGRVKVLFERPDERDGFHDATCYLPDYSWEDVSGFSKADMKRNERLLKEVAHIIIELSQEGGFDNASGF